MLVIDYLVVRVEIIEAKYEETALRKEYWETDCGKEDLPIHGY